MFPIFFHYFLSFLDDLDSCRRKIAEHYDSVFTDIILYSSDKESEKTAIHDLYVPMVWKKVDDPDTVMKDKDIDSPLSLFRQVV